MIEDGDVGLVQGELNSGEGEALGVGQQPLFEGDRGRLAPKVRRVLTLLIRDAYVCAFESPEDFETIRNNHDALEEVLNELGLTLTVSPRYEVAYAQQACLDESGPLMLKRAQPLRRDATILLVSIRVRQHNDEANGQEDWFVERSELSSLLKSGPYNSELDGSRIERALNSAIKQLEEAGYLKRTSAAHDTFRVMPVLPAVFTLERAHDLLDTFSGETDVTSEDSLVEGSDDD